MPDIQSRFRFGSPCKSLEPQNSDKLWSVMGIWLEKKISEIQTEKDQWKQLVGYLIELRLLPNTLLSSRPCY